MYHHHAWIGLGFTAHQHNLGHFELGGYSVTLVCVTWLFYVLCDTQVLGLSYYLQEFFPTP
jgi:hypothetical protein